MADLTGQPYLAVDRQSTVVTAAVTEISTALHDITLDDVPDISARPMAQLTSAAALAHACADDASYGLAGRGLAALLVELQVHAVTGGSDTRRAALIALVEACKVAYILAKTKDNTITAEACGMLHLTTALIAARDGRTGDVATHLAEARSLAAHTGERNHMRYHFGPTNVAAWELGLAVEAGTGPVIAERLAAMPIDLSVFSSKGRAAYVHFDLARAWAQADGSHHGEDVRALDTADHLAPVRIRNDPIARDLVVTLDQRAPRRARHSLRNRFGIGKRLDGV